MPDDPTPTGGSGPSSSDPWGSGPPSPTPPPPTPPQRPSDPWPAPQQQQGPAPATGTDPLAIVALVLGILALPFFWVFVLGIAAIVCGAIALSRIGRTRRGGRGMAIAGVVLGAASLVLGALIVAILVLGSSDDEFAITDARPGDCIDLATQSGNNIETYTPRECDEDHELEVVGIVTVPDGPYPGQQELNDLADERCRSLFAGYVGIEFDDSELAMQPLLPTSEAWDEGDHEIACVVQTDTGRPLTGSVRGSRR